MPLVNLLLPSAGTRINAGLHAENYLDLQLLLNGGLDGANLSSMGASSGDSLVWTGSAWVPQTVQGMPTGASIPFAGNTAPTGFLLCDGTSYLRAAEPALFAVIGTLWGAADGTHFNVPDMRGRIPVGKGTHTSVDTVGETDGDATVANRTIKHKHTKNGSVSKTGSATLTGSVGFSDPTHEHENTMGSGTGGNVHTPAPGNGSGGNGTGVVHASTGIVVNNGTLAVSDGIGVSDTITIGPQTGEPTDGSSYGVMNFIIKT